MNGKWAVTAGMFILLLAGAAAPAADKRIAVPIGTSPTLGPESAPVTIVEFIDFQ